MDATNTQAGPVTTLADTGISTDATGIKSYAVSLLSALEVLPVPAGMRLAAINYKLMDKQKKAGKSKPDNKGVFVPLLKVGSMDFGCMPGDTADTDSAPQLRTVIADMLADQQDELIRKHINEGLAELKDEHINASSLLAFMTAQQDSRRLTKEAIGAFFDAELAATLGAMICNKQGWDAASLTLEQSAGIAKTTSEYRDAYCKLAAVSPTITKDDAERMTRVIDGSESQQPIASTLVAKLDRIINPKVTVNLAAI